MILEYPQAVVGWAVILTVLTLSNVAANVATLVRTTRAQRREITFGLQPVNKEVAETRHKALEHRVDALERGLAETSKMMQAEDEEIRRELRNYFQEIERALGRIEGQLTLLRQMTHFDSGDNS